MIVALTAYAQVTYRTADLKRLAAVLAIDEDSLTEDGYHYLTANRQRVVVGVKGGVVCHIGLQLFKEEVRSIDNPPVFEFLERYFLQLSYPPQAKTKASMVEDAQFCFLTGSLQTVKSLLPTDDFSCALDHNSYRARWSRNGKDLLEVSFPAEYELISGENKMEAEDNIVGDILRTTIVADTVSQSRAAGNHYILPSMSSRLYFQNGKLVADKSRLEQSVANIMLTTATNGDYQLKVTQLSYGFKMTNFEVPLKQWISFCRNNHCQLYFGVENVDADGTLSGVVIAVNELENYNHVLTVKVPSSIVGQQEGRIEAYLYPYIPTHNVKALFAKFSTSNKKEITFE